VRNVDGTAIPTPSQDTTDRVDADAREEDVAKYLDNDDPEKWRLAGQVAFNLLNDTVYDGKLSRVPRTAGS
jgi:hypothetical protein